MVPLGLSAFALTTFVFSILNLDPYSYPGSLFLFQACAGLQIATGLAIFCGGLVQLIAGVLALRTRNVFTATAFCINGGFWLVFGLAPWLGLLPARSMGYFLLVWTILTVPVFIVTLKTNIAFLVISSLAFLTFLALAIGILVDGTFIVIGGWLGILLAIVAWYMALAFLLVEGRSSFVLPIGLKRS